MTSPARTVRQRRRPEEAEREILDAAEGLLREGGYPLLTVAQVMARTGLGRSSFYVYFSDIPDLLRKLAARLEGEFFEVSQAWLGGATVPDGSADGRDADMEAARLSTEGIVGVYVRHGPVLRALSDAMGTHPEVEQIFRWGMVEHLIEAVTRRCEQRHASGHIPHPVPREVCRALVVMTGNYLDETLGRPPGDDPAAVAHTLYTIWARVLYARDPLPTPLTP